MRRPWRVIFAICALAISIASHWPRLNVSSDSLMIDLTFHASAFGVLTIALWNAAWVKRLMWLAMIMLVWALLDEGSQAIPALRRHATVQDGLANAFGVSMVLLWLWALAPIGGAANRLRLDFERFVNEETFASRRTLTLLLIVLVGTAGPLTLLLLILPRGSYDLAIGISAFVWISMSILVLVGQRRPVRWRWAGLRPCLACGVSCRGIDFDPHGEGTCPRCGGAVHRGTWSNAGLPPSLIRASLKDALRQPEVLIVAALLTPLIVVLWLAGEFAVYTAHVELYPWQMRLISVAALLGLIAPLMRVFRHFVARRYDHHRQCTRCGHDLRGTPAVQGVGRCGECGQRFVRIKQG